ncbi:hypothetical protein [Brevibacillus laterosporus]|uniref:hypothetical protein n=1 Tax=Brevibacillus laterosporus TaxID=1465 RepID=UPI002E1A871E|nr:hypothetical protein [Brevibacillus laterosporus]MED1667210.1 hypothetical protein [Brevibacillus laterosporus]MED1719722.1 hypothetical protein [Brevibacillus laterosporus]
MEFKFEKSKLYNYLGKELVGELKRTKAYIAGGTITSLFCNREINDLDVYFRNEESMIDFLESLWDETGTYVVSLTKKSILLLKNSLQIQLIHDRMYESPKEIFKAFDFTVCMGCYDFDTDSFILHEDFLRHNAQRQLTFNPDTLYPVVSALRVQKYEDKGYEISKTEFLKIMLSCMKLEINSYDELKNHLGGMYGINLDKVFDETKEFSLEDAIIQISNLFHHENYFVKPVQIEFHNLDDIITQISKTPIKYIELKNKFYKIKSDGTLTYITKRPENGIEVNKGEYFADKKFYKFVEKKDGRYFSYYDKNFEYIIGAEAQPKNDYLYFGFIEDVSDFSYKNKTNRVLLEALVLPSSIKGFDDVAFLIDRCEILREVPEEEYKQFMESDSFEFWG